MFFYRLASTERYKNALIYLDEYENENDFLLFLKICYKKYEEETRVYDPLLFNEYYWHFSLE